MNSRQPDAQRDTERDSVPEPQIDGEWEVVGGTLIIEPEPLVEFPGTTNLIADGLVVETAEGEPVTLDPISVVSECWGCFAG